MKTFIMTVGLAAALVFALFPDQARAQDNNLQADNSNVQADNGAAPVDDSVSFQTFYNQLASQGSWIQTDQYGYVFQPAESDPNWRPYTYGHWVNTDAGMTWVSDEQFGWATDHYGRWVNLDGYGWVWVPGYTWAPAWVSWRDGDGYVGWAPLPPDSDVGIDYYTDDDYFTGSFFDFGFHIGDDCDLAYGIGAYWYNFCPVAFIGDRDCWRHFRDPRDNFALIDHTRNVTNINFHRDAAGRFDRVHAGGPSVAGLNASARTPIEHARLTSASRLGEAGLRGNTLAVFAPRVDPATARTARPESVARTLATTSVNRGTDINRPLAVNSRFSPAGPTAEQLHAATLAQGNVPANAKIATADSRFSRSLTQPLTSLRTGTRAAATFGTGLRSNGVAQASRGSTPSVSTESRYTGGATVPRSTISSSAESRFTGEAEVAPSRPFSTFRSAPAYDSGQIYHPSSVFHSSAPVYHSQPSFQSSAPAFHSSAPAYYPQSSFHSFAPASQPHFGGGAPAAHFSSGGFSGGSRPSGGGGGAVHASGGGGFSGYGGRH